MDDKKGIQPRNVVLFFRIEQHTTKSDCSKIKIRQIADIDTTRKKRKNEAILQPEPIIEKKKVKP